MVLFATPADANALTIPCVSAEARPFRPRLVIHEADETDEVREKDSKRGGKKLSVGPPFRQYHDGRVSCRPPPASPGVRWQNLS